MGASVAHWWYQRLSAVILVGLLVWLIMALWGSMALSYDSLLRWLTSGINRLLLAGLFGMVFWHGYLGAVVVIDDYVHASFWHRIGRAVCASVVFIFLSFGVGIVTFFCLRVFYGFV